jgi:hypothetical protein
VLISYHLFEFSFFNLHFAIIIIKELLFKNINLIKKKLFVVSDYPRKNIFIRLSGNRTLVVTSISSSEKIKRSNEEGKSRNHR